MHIFRTDSLKRFLASESATTAVEYAVMIGLVILAAIGGIALFGSEGLNLWSNNASEINSVTSS